jgi:O-antigen/teichoic acid export membrane protein
MWTQGKEEQLENKFSFDSNIIIAVGISYIGYFASFISSILVARILGVEGKGLFSLFMETTFAIVVFSTLGVTNGQLYEVARNPRNLKHFIPNAFVCSITLGGGGALIYYTNGIIWDFKIVTLLGLPTIILGILVTPVMMMIIFQRQYFLAIHSYKKAKMNYTITMITPLITYLVIYSFLNVSILNLIIGFIISQFLSFVIFQYLCFQSAPRGGGFSLSLAKKSISFGILQYPSYFCEFLTRRLDFFLVALILGKSGLGIYSVAVSLAEIISRLTHEIGTILFPAFASGEIPTGQAVHILRKTLFLGLLVACPLAILSRPIVMIIFGKQFMEAALSFQLLLIGTVALSTIDVTWNRIAASGRPGLGTPIFGAAVLLDAGMNLILLPKMGVIGACIASIVSYWLAALIFLWIFCKKEGCSIKDVLLVRKDDIQSIIKLIIGIRKIGFKRFV